MHTSTLVVLFVVIIQCTWQQTDSESGIVIRGKRTEPDGSGEVTEKPESSGNGSGEVDVEGSGEGSGVEGSGQNIDKNELTDKPTLLALL